MGISPGITFILPEAPAASAGPRNTIQAYGRRAEKNSFSVVGPLWNAGERRLGHSATDCPPCKSLWIARFELFRPYGVAETCATSFSKISAASARLARQHRFPADFRAEGRDGVQFDGMTSRRNCGAVAGENTTR
jgi:hypothetical protein